MLMQRKRMMNHHKKIQMNLRMKELMIIIDLDKELIKMRLRALRISIKHTINSSRNFIMKKEQIYLFLKRIWSCMNLNKKIK
jgi:hypothetical protein